MFAAFRAKEVWVDTGVPAPPGHCSLAGIDFRDVHAIDRGSVTPHEARAKAWRGIVKDVLNVQAGCRASEDEWPYHPESVPRQDLAGLFQIKQMRM